MTTLTLTDARSAARYILVNKLAVVGAALAGMEQGDYAWRRGQPYMGPHEEERDGWVCLHCELQGGRSVRW